MQPSPPAEEIDSTPAGGKTVWRCIVCGYLCAREKPPAVCPICKAKADRFEEFGQILVTGKEEQPGES